MWSIFYNIQRKLEELRSAVTNNNASLPVFPISMLNRLRGLFGFCCVLVEYRTNI